jgi:hypothetical protein
MSGSGPGAARAATSAAPVGVVRSPLEHGCPQLHLGEREGGVLARRRAAREEGLQRLGGELRDALAVDPARPAALELLVGRREHAEAH